MLRFHYNHNWHLFWNYVCELCLYEEMNIILSVFFKFLTTFEAYKQIVKLMVCEQCCSVPIHPIHYVGYFSALLHDPESFGTMLNGGSVWHNPCPLPDLRDKNFEYSLIQNNECHNFYRSKFNLIYDIFFINLEMFSAYWLLLFLHLSL